ncbi:MAG: hypothetical protein A3H91_02585 [Gammaproteobacteria bacterium RIFCSPLOWO2_02_FULL_61_13]|nr:MAG: hypothetical protein A3H91_02585 [Gammaproteobacteria bacterium RIFCSPLOWO2_02_FULL_61_13]
MKNLMAIIAALAFTFMANLLPAVAGEAESYHLKDGSMLYIQADGNMKMVNTAGKPMQMEEDVPMELQDGTIIMMRHNHVWKRLGPPGKGPEVLTHE